MKKLAILVSVLLLLGLVTACGKSELAQSVIDQITTIGRVDLDKERLIASAEKAYQELSDREKGQVDNLDLLEEARRSYDKLVEEKFDEIASVVEKAITEIGSVKLNSKDAIAEVRKKYEALEADIRSRVKNYDALVTAETTLFSLQVDDIEGAIRNIGSVNLQKGDKIRQARRTFEQYDSAVQEKVANLAVLEAAETQFENLRIERVVNKIDEIGTVTLNSERSINDARTTYNELSGSEASKVSNYGSLKEAEESIKQIKAEAAKKAFEAAKSRLRSEYDQVQKITFYYSKNTPVYADTRCTVIPYIGQYDQGTTFLLGFFHYTGDYWVFFKKVTISIDGKNTVKSFSYFDITRDNEWGKVWEYVHFDPTQSDIDLFIKIADSKQTIVRFEGDDHYHDYVVSSKDKEGIKDILAVYDYWKEGR